MSWAGHGGGGVGREVLVEAGVRHGRGAGCLQGGRAGLLGWVLAPAPVQAVPAQRPDLVPQNSRKKTIIDICWEF